MRDVTQTGCLSIILSDKLAADLCIVSNLSMYFCLNDTNLLKNILKMI